MTTRACCWSLLALVFVTPVVLADEAVTPTERAAAQHLFPSNAPDQKQAVHFGRGYGPLPIQRVRRTPLRQTEKLPWAAERPKVDLYDSRPYTPILPPNID